MRSASIRSACIVVIALLVQAPTTGISPARGDDLTLDLGGGVKMELLLISPGSFTMGTENNDGDEKAHKVTITQPFYLGKYEVTQEQWQAIMGSNPSNFKDPKTPVEQVSWEDCQGFLKKLENKSSGTKFSLPTEAQWEYACRAGSTTKFCFGDEEAGLGEYGWYPGNAQRKTHPVGQKKPNAWGLYDMHGNVWEWCADWYGGDSYSASDPSDPKGPDSGSNRVLRGGCWSGYPSGCRSACRLDDSPSYRSRSVGFRVACER